MKRLCAQCGQRPPISRVRDKMGVMRYGVRNDGHDLCRQCNDSAESARHAQHIAPKSRDHGPEVTRLRLRKDERC